MNTYGTLTLLSSSPAGGFDEPITLAEAKAFLGLPERSPSDAEEDALIEAMIASAREIAETMQNRDLVRKYYSLSLDFWPGSEIELRPDLVEVLGFRYRDSDGATTTMVADTDYIVDTVKQPGLIMPPYAESWPSFTPWPSSAITIEFVSGLASGAPFWSDAGERVKIGMRLLISAWFTNRLPYQEWGPFAIQEFPLAMTACMSFGALPRVR